MLDKVIGRGLVGDCRRARLDMFVSLRRRVARRTVASTGRSGAPPPPGTEKGGEPQGSREGRPRDPLREGVARADVSGEGNIVETLNSKTMSPKLDRLSAPNHEKIPGERW